jgi:hypothetical protein
MLIASSVVAHVVIAMAVDLLLAQIICKDSTR